MDDNRMRRIKVIVNPMAGQGRALRVLSQVEEILRTQGIEYDVAKTSAPGHGSRLAQMATQEGWPQVAAIGGDGTINEVLQGVIHTDTMLSIIPGGTGNDLARSLAIPLEIPAAATLLWSGTPAKMDVGMETNRGFASLASLGFPVDVIAHVNENKSIFSGSIKIFAGVWKTLCNLRSHPMTIRTDGQVRRVEAIGVFVQNTRSAGGGLMIAPEAHPADGMLDLVIIHRISRWDLITTLPKAYKGTHVDHPAVEIVRCRRVTIEPDLPMTKMVDGELVGTAPIQASLVRQALKILVPPETASLLNASQLDSVAVSAR